MRSGYRSILGPITGLCLSLTIAGTIRAEVSGSVLDSIAVPDGVQAEINRLRTRATIHGDAILPDEWRRVAEIRAAQEGRPVAEVLAEVRDIYGAALAHLPPATRGGTPVIRVGNDIGGCDFLATAGNNGLQQAMDAAAVDANGPGLTEIRVANSGDYAGRRYFLNDAAGGDQSVMIVGGYSFCDSAAPSGNTTLNRGGASGPVILIDQTAAAQTVFLENLRVQGGAGTNGGGLEIRNNNFVVGTNLIASTNSATDGGGIHLTDTADADPTVLWLLDGSAVSSNTASGNGGGMYCSGNGAVVALDAIVSINSNSAQNGGGLFVTGGCGVDSFASFPSGVFSNTATVNGGGGYLEAGGEVTLIGGAGGFGFGDATRRTTLDSNRANGAGGGLFATGTTSTITARDSWIASNTADADADDSGSGGGVALNFGARFFMDRTLAGSACHSANRCSVLAGNSAQMGGAVAAGGNGVGVDIRQTWIEDNQADGPASAVIVNNTGGNPAEPGTLFMEGNMIVNNPASTTDLGGLQGVVDVQSNTDTTIAFTTFADNLTSSSGRDLIVFNDADVQLYSDIIWESTGEVFFANWDADTTGRVDCIVVHETGSLPPDPPSPGSIFSADPQFVAPGPAGNYRLAGTSPAVDFCDTAVYIPVESDIDGEARGFDVAGNSNFLGPYDLGADEFVGALNGGTVQFATTLIDVMEGDGTVVVPISRAGGSEGETSFQVTAFNITATEGSDYTALPTLVSWSNGDNTPRLVNFGILDDGISEPHEQFRVDLDYNSGSGVLGVPATIIIRIYDNEDAIFADSYEGIP